MAITDFITRRSFVRGASIAAASTAVAIPAAVVAAPVDIDPKDRVQNALQELVDATVAAYPEHKVQLANTFFDLDLGLGGGGCILMVTRAER